MRRGTRMCCLVMDLRCPKPLPLYHPRDPRASDLWRLMDTSCSKWTPSTPRWVKTTLPGPYLLTRAMWVTSYSGSAYGDKPVMADDVVSILREELEELVDEGAEFVQFDEPVLTEVVHSSDDKRRTFM